MSKQITLLAFLFGSLVLSAQKEDYIWYGGQNEYPGTSGNGNYRIRFENGVPEIDSIDLGVNFESTVATLCDSTGHLRFSTNGCRVYNKYGQPMKSWNGTDTLEINPGELHDSTCSNVGFIAPRGAMFLPASPHYSSVHALLFYMNMHYDNKWGLVYGPFFQTTMNPVNLTQPDYEVLPLKLAPVAQVLRYEPFTTVRHGNGADWWVVVPEFGKNRYNIIQTSGVTWVDKSLQDIGPTMKCKIGSTVFSPNGSKYARVHNCGVTVMDFDRCTGQFSNPVYIERPSHTFGGGGAAFSDNGQELIVSSQLAILKANLSDATPHFDTLISAENLYGYSLEQIQQGPDGNLYFSTMQRSKKMPVLKDPFGPSPIMEFLDLPVYSVRSLPHFPNYRLYDLPGSPCDTFGISSTAGPLPSTSLTIFPNPASQSFFIETDQTGSYQLSISDFTGKIWLTRTCSENRLELQLPDDVATGVHFLKMKSPDGFCQFQKLIIIAR